MVEPLPVEHGKGRALAGSLRNDFETLSVTEDYLNHYGVSAAYKKNGEVSIVAFSHANNVGAAS